MSYAVIVSHKLAFNNYYCSLLVLVNRGSVDAQKQVDEYERLNPYTHSYYLADQGRPRAFNSFTCINSYFKGRAGGTGSSFQTARYYAEQASIRRAELLEQVSGSS